MLIGAFSYHEPGEYKDTKINIDIERRGRRDDQRIDIDVDRRQTRDQTFETQLDITERDYRRRTDPTYDVEYERRRPTEEIQVEKEDIKINEPRRNDMGYYDDQGEYHSFRRGLERAADRVAHPFRSSHHHHHDREEVVIEDEERGPSRVREGVREEVRFVEPRRGYSSNTVTIPCQFIRVGDLVILQGRPCQIIRITTSPQTGQYRYLGVDLFTRQLQEESSFMSNPQASVYVQSMLGPVYKQYRILDMRSDGLIVCMTETGDVKQGLRVIDQGGLYGRIEAAFADCRGSIRALIINDGGRELVVDYKVIHGSRL